MKPKPFSISDHRAPNPIIIKDSGGQPSEKSSNTGLYLSLAFMFISNIAWAIYVNRKSKESARIIRGLEADVTKLKPLAANAGQTQKQENQISSSTETNKDENQSNTAAPVKNISDSNQPSSKLA